MFRCSSFEHLVSSFPRASTQVVPEKLCLICPPHLECHTLTLPSHPVSSHAFRQQACYHCLQEAFPACPHCTRAPCFSLLLSPTAPSSSPFMFVPVSLRLSPSCTIPCLHWGQEPHLSLLTISHPAVKAPGHSIIMRAMNDSFTQALLPVCTGNPRARSRLQAGGWSCAVVLGADAKQVKLSPRRVHTRHPG